jgi:hypothetical protein
MASGPVSSQPAGSSSLVGLKQLALFLGISVEVTIALGIWLASSAQDARRDAQVAATKAATPKAASGTFMTAHAMRGMSASATEEGSYATPSFAGIAPAGSEALAFAHGRTRQRYRQRRRARSHKPGLFMYHCGAAPPFVHVANGMRGAIVVEPRHLPPAQKQYLLVSSEW